jgi:hypothetical protein
MLFYISINRKTFFECFKKVKYYDVSVVKWPAERVTNYQFFNPFREGSGASENLLEAFLKALSEFYERECFFESKEKTISTIGFAALPFFYSLEKLKIISKNDFYERWTFYKWLSGSGSHEVIEEKGRKYIFIKNPFDEKNGCYVFFDAINNERSIGFSYGSEKNPTCIRQAFFEAQRNLESRLLFESKKQRGERSKGYEYQIISKEGPSLISKVDFRLKKSNISKEEEWIQPNLYYEELKTRDKYSLFRYFFRAFRCGEL